MSDTSGFTASEAVLERFWSKIEPLGDCWLWKNWRDRQGYGRFRMNGITKLAHRVSYELHVGPIQNGMCVLHRCDTPACVSPAHLFLGTHADNIDDCIAKGRKARGERHGRAKLTSADVLEIRASTGKISDIAKRYGVSDATISHVRLRLNWKHVEGNV